MTSKGITDNPVVRGDGIVDRERALRERVTNRMGLALGALLLMVGGIVASFWLSTQPPRVVVEMEDGMLMGGTVRQWQYRENRLASMMQAILEGAFLRTEQEKVEGLEDFFTRDAWADLAAAMQQIPQDKGFAQVLRLRDIRVRSKRPHFAEVWWEGELTSHTMTSSNKVVLYLATAWIRGQPTRRNPTGWRCGAIRPLSAQYYFADERAAELRRRTGVDDPVPSQPEERQP